MHRNFLMNTVVTFVLTLIAAFAGAAFSHYMTVDYQISQEKLSLASYLEATSEELALVENLVLPPSNEVSDVAFRQYPRKVTKPMLIYKLMNSGDISKYMSSTSLLATVNALKCYDVLFLMYFSEKIDEKVKSVVNKKLYKVSGLIRSIYQSEVRYLNGEITKKQRRDVVTRLWNGYMKSSVDAESRGELYEFLGWDELVNELNKNKINDNDSGLYISDFGCT